MAAQFATPETINFMAQRPRADLPGADPGPLRRARARPDGGQERVAVRDALHRLDRGARGRHDRHLAPHDRAHTIQVAIDPRDAARATSSSRGHVFPLKAKPGGVLERTGPDRGGGRPRPAGRPDPGRRDLRDHERRRDDGARPRPDPLLRAPRAEDDHRRRPDRLPPQARQARRARGRDARCRPRSASSTPSATARWSTTSTTSRSSRATSTARTTCSCGCTPSASPATSSTRCAATAASSSSRRWPRSSARAPACCSTSPRRAAGSGCSNKLRAYKLQDGGLDTVDANLELGLPVDLRDYGIGAQILVDLGLGSIRILTNNPKKIIGLEGYGLSVTEQVPIQHAANPHNAAYLDAKRDPPRPHAPPPGAAAGRGDAARRARARPRRARSRAAGVA